MFFFIIHHFQPKSNPDSQHFGSQLEGEVGGTSSLVCGPFSVCLPPSHPHLPSKTVFLFVPDWRIHLECSPGEGKRFLPAAWIWGGHLGAKLTTDFLL